MRSSQELYEILSHVEQLMDVNQLRVGERNIWPVLRAYAASRLKRKTPDKVSKGRQPRWFNNWQQQKQQAYLDQKDINQRGLYAADFVTVGYASNRILEEDGKMWNPGLDPLHFLFAPRLGLSLEAAFTADGLSSNAPIPPVSLLSRMHRHRIEEGSSRKGWSSEVFQWCHQMEELFEDTFFHSENVSLWVDMMISAEHMFEEVFEQVKPQALFVAGFYDPIFFGAIKSAKKCGIPTVDMQCDNQSDNHFGYHGWKGAGDDSYQYIPDQFWHWSQREVNEQLESFFKGKVKHLNVGRPLDLWRQAKDEPQAIQKQWDGFYEQLVSGTD